MEDIQIALAKVRAEENELRFNTFNSKIAWQLGGLLVKKAQKEATRPIVVSITLNRHKLFYFAFDGTTPDNEAWIERKENSVYRFYKSTRQLDLYMRSINDTIFDRYVVSKSDFTQMGGGFPISVFGMGVVGTVTVSGLSEVEDHEIIVAGMREYLQVKVQ